jgi:NAD+ synthase (glutamine-hydrolysing)
LLWDQVKACGINDELEEDEMGILTDRDTADGVKVAVVQMNVIAKRPEINAAKMFDALRNAKENGADVAVFPEMAIPGYLVGDDWEDKAFVDECFAWQNDIFRLAADLGIAVVLGNIAPVHSGKVLAEDGRLAHHNSAITYIPGIGSLQYDKTNLPNYREFDDKRYFRSGTSCRDVVLHKNTRITTSICEDGWDEDYEHKPVQDASKAGGSFAVETRAPHLHLNLSCSPFTKGKNDARNRRFGNHSLPFAALIYVNNVGVQNNGKNVFTFDGSSTVYVGGKVLAALPPLVECIGYVTVCGRSVEVNEGPWLPAQKDPELHEVLTYAIKEFCAQSGIRRTVIGLSGGVDSALSVMLHVKALGAENVITVNMPTKFNSETTKGIAKEIAENLGVRYLEIPIGGAVDNFIDTVHGGMWASGVNSDEFWDDTENIQARMRGAGVQAMLAAGFKAVFPNNGNKAEVTVGYCTMGGDHMGYLAPIGDLWKSEVYETAKVMSATFDKPVIPDALFTIKPSAELSEAQSVDAGKGDPIIYWYHDKLFASWVEPWNRDNIEDTLRHYVQGDLLTHLGIPAEKHAEFKTLFPAAKDFVADLERWWTLFKGMGTVKRVQAPPTVVVSRRAFGFDFREAIGTIHYTRKYLEMKEKVLAAP